MNRPGRIAGDARPSPRPSPEPPGRAGLALPMGPVRQGKPCPTQDCQGRAGTALATLATALALVIATYLSCPTESPAQAVASAKPKSTNLLKSAPFERITLTDGSAFEIEPLSPRPLPPVESRKGRSLVELDEAARKAEERRRRPRDPFSKREEDEEEAPVIIHMLAGEPRDFKVKRASIKAVEYFEDMLLAEGERLAKEGDYTRAFERFLLVKARDPSWKGLEEHVNDLLFEEGGAALIGDNPRGLRLLNDLHARKPD
jgi:peptide/nickel transport system substrate-binding protein